jgi:hypothetical protein
MRVQMRLIEALVDADPNPEAEAENAVSSPIRMNQRSMFFMPSLPKNRVPGD